MRAPLRAIKTLTHIVLEDHGAILPPEAGDLLNKVVAAARMDKLMGDVLAFSRVSRQPISLRPVNLQELIQNLLAERPELQPPRAEITVEDPLLPVLGHEASLNQCLANLLGNAVKFVPPGVKPKVRVRTELVEPSEPGIAARPRVRLWVEDNGIGISPEGQQKVFELFVRLTGDYEGTGLGLAIVKKAAERMGGRAGVESEPGKGSRFWLELPHLASSQMSHGAPF